MKLLNLLMPWLQLPRQKDFDQISSDPGSAQENHSEFSGQDTGPISYHLQIDLRFCMDRLNVKERARIAATHNMPAESEEDLDHCQREIVEYCESELDKLRRNTNERLRYFQRERQGINLSAINSKLNDIAVMCELSISRLKARAMEVIKEKQTKAISSQSELKDFMIDNNLTRAAHYPAHPAMHNLNILYVIVLEGIFNTAFFMIDKGLTESLFVSFIAAAANTVLALFAGYFPFRWKNFANRTKSKLGYMLSALWVFMLLGFNGMLAGYRMTLTGSVDLKTETMKWALDFLSNSAEDPQGRMVQSVVLFMVGVLAGLYSCRTGYTADDPYPGYKEVTENYKARREELEHSVHALLEDINHIVDNALSDIDRSLDVAEHESNRYNRLLNDSILAHKEFVDLADRVEGVCNALLKAYRDINRAMRNAPPPAYFLYDHKLDKDISPPELTPDGEMKIRNREILSNMNGNASNQRVSLRNLNQLQQSEVAKILFDVESRLKENLAPATPKTSLALGDIPLRKSTATPQPIAYDEVTAPKKNGHDPKSISPDV